MRHTNEAGSATIEMTWLVLLLLVPFIYAVIAVFDVQRASYAAATASSAATRAFVQAPDEQSAHSRAQRAADVAWRDFGIGTPLNVQVSCDPACFTPGASVDVEVATRQPLPLVPDAWSNTVGGLDISSTHREPFGAYREAP